jgi:hypothetical protein
MDSTATWSDAILSEVRRFLTTAEEAGRTIIGSVSHASAAGHSGATGSSHVMKSGIDPFGRNRWVSEKDKTECVAFVRQSTGLGVATDKWRPGARVKDAPSGSIPLYTAIATFVDGHYPNAEDKADGLGKHAAIYLRHDAEQIWVLDQWNKQGEVKKRPIQFSHTPDRPSYRRSNDGNLFFVILS